MPTKREKKFRKTFEKMEGFSFVTPVTGLNRPNTGNEDDDDDGLFNDAVICTKNMASNNGIFANNELERM
jgi:hypothetical protein